MEKIVNNTIKIYWIKILKGGEKLMHIVWIAIISISSLVFASIRYEIKNLEYHIGNTSGKNNYEIIMTIFVFSKLPVFRKKISKAKVIKFLTSYKMKKIEKREENKMLKDKNLIDIKIFKSIKYLADIEMEVKKFNLKAEIGVEDIVIKNMLVTLIGSVIGGVLAKKIRKQKDVYFVVAPASNNINKVDIFLNIVVDVKVRNMYKVYRKIKNQNKELVQK